MSKPPIVCAMVMTFALPLFAQPTPAITDGDLLKNVSVDESAEPAKQKPAEKTADKPPKKEKGPTEITSDSADFDQKSNRAIFTGNVIVNDPEFHLTCDKLTALLKSTKPAPANGAAPANGDPKSKPATPVPATPTPKVTPAGAKPGAKQQQDGQGGLEKAIAEVKGDNWVVIVQEKIDANGKVSTNTGKSKRAEYDTATGEITLKGWPEVRQGINSSVAENEGTVMILNRDGEMHTIGRAKVRLQETSGTEKPVKP